MKVAWQSTKAKLGTCALVDHALGRMPKFATATSLKRACAKIEQAKTCSTLIQARVEPL